MEFSKSSKKALADADFRNFGIARDSVDFRSNITFSAFHLYPILVMMRWAVNLFPVLDNPFLSDKKFNGCRNPC